MGRLAAGPRSCPGALGPPPRSLHRRPPPCNKSHRSLSSSPHPQCTLLADLRNPGCPRRPQPPPQAPAPQTPPSRTRGGAREALGAAARGLRAGRTAGRPPRAASRGPRPAPPALAGSAATSTASLCLPPPRPPGAADRDAPRPCPPRLRAGPRDPPPATSPGRGGTAHPPAEARRAPQPAPRSPSRSRPPRRPLSAAPRPRPSPRPSSRPAAPTRIPGSASETGGDTRRRLRDSGSDRASRSLRRGFRPAPQDALAAHWLAAEGWAPIAVARPLPPAPQPRVADPARAQSSSRAGACWARLLGAAARALRSGARLASAFPSVAHCPPFTDKKTRPEGMKRRLGPLGLAAFPGPPRTAGSTSSPALPCRAPRPWPRRAVRGRRPSLAPDAAPGPTPLNPGVQQRCGTSESTPRRPHCSWKTRCPRPRGADGYLHNRNALSEVCLRRPPQPDIKLKTQNDGPG